MGCGRVATGHRSRGIAQQLLSSMYQLQKLKSTDEIGYGSRACTALALVSRCFPLQIKAAGFSSNRESAQ